MLRYGRHTLHRDARSRSGYAHRGNRPVIFIEDRRANAAHAELNLFIVDGIAASANLVERLQQSLARTQRLWRVAHKTNLRDDLLDSLHRLEGKHRLAH